MEEFKADILSYLAFQNQCYVYLFDSKLLFSRQEESFTFNNSFKEQHLIKVHSFKVQELWLNVTYLTDSCPKGSEV